MRIGVNGIQINVRDRGKGEPSLVFLHYWGGSSRTWTEVVDYLADQHRSIALDHRGWGESDAPGTGYGIADLTSDALGVVGTLELRHFVVVGHSMGDLPAIARARHLEPQRRRFGALSQARRFRSWVEGATA